MIKRSRTLLSCCTALLVILSILLSGCGFKDIDKRFFVVATGIDLSDDEEKPYRITLKLAVPSVNIDPGNSKSQVESINTASISEGIRMLKAQVDKEIDFGHCNVFLVGEALANKDITETVYWMSRRRDVQNIAVVGIGRPNAQKIISGQPQVERLPGNALNLFFSNDGTESSYTYEELLTDLFRRITEKGLDPVLPIVEVQKDNTYIINKIALMDKKKVAIILEPSETQLFNQISGHLAQSNVYGSFRSNKYVVALNNISTKYAMGNESNPIVNMKIKQAITIEEVPPNETLVTLNSMIDELEKAYSEDVSNLLVKIQKAGVDPYGFGLRYRANYHLEQFDEKWPGIYDQLRFEVSTKMKTRGTGLLR